MWKSCLLIITLKWGFEGVFDRKKENEKENEFYDVYSLLFWIWRLVKECDVEKLNMKIGERIRGWDMKKEERVFFIKVGLVSC